MAANIVTKNKTKFRVNTDIGAFRQALYDAGYIDAAVNFIYNDKRAKNRRLKSWCLVNYYRPDRQTGSIEQLAIALEKYFGDRLISHNRYKGNNYIVCLKY